MIIKASKKTSCSYCNKIIEAGDFYYYHKSKEEYYKTFTKKDYVCKDCVLNFLHLKEVYDKIISKQMIEELKR